jgi:uncharacterized protein (TIGR03083 family)
MATTTTPGVWDLVPRYRHAVADRFDQMSAEQWDLPTWCGDWRARDVLGHLVHIAEGSQRSMAVDIVRNGMVPDRALSRCACALGQEPVSALTQRLRAAAGGRFHVPGSPAVVALGELFVHGADVFDPLGITYDVSGDDASSALPAYWRLGRLAFHSSAYAKLRLVATDTDWSAGKGAEVHGSALALLQLMANRRQVIPHLSGPGVAAL